MFYKTQLPQTHTKMSSENLNKHLPKLYISSKNHCSMYCCKVTRWCRQWVVWVWLCWEIPISLQSISM